MLNLILTRRISSYLESTLMIKITEWVIFGLIPIGPGKQPVQEAYEFWFSVAREMSNCKKSTSFGSWTCKTSKRGLEQTSMKSLFSVKPSTQQYSLSVVPFSGSCWLSCGLPDTCQRRSRSKEAADLFSRTNATEKDHMTTSRDITNGITAWRGINIRRVLLWPPFCPVKKYLFSFAFKN